MKPRRPWHVAKLEFISVNSWTMSSPSLLPVEEQGGVQIEKQQDAKDKKGTLTNLIKKSQELAAKAAAEPEVIELLDDSLPEGDQQQQLAGGDDATPAAPEDKEAEAQPAEENDTNAEVIEPAAEQVEPAEDNSDQVNLKILKICLKFLGDRALKCHSPYTKVTNLEIRAE